MAPTLYQLPLLLCALLGVAADGLLTASLPARAEPLIPDSATGAGAELEPWTNGVVPPVPLSPTVPSRAPERPERPAMVPQVVPVGDLALQLQPPTAGDGGTRPLGPLHYPLATGALEQDPWGWRYSSARGAWRMHTGLDLIVPEGTAVLAVLPGRVQRVDAINGYGLTVLIDHGGGWSSLYAHLLKATVGPGDSVEAGQRLGLVGQSGSASTPHLHLELRQRQPRGLVAVDPTALLPAPPVGSALAGDMRP